MSNNFVSSNYNIGQSSPFFATNKPIYLGDEKNLKKKRGMELL